VSARRYDLRRRAQTSASNNGAAIAHASSREFAPGAALQPNATVRPPSSVENIALLAAPAQTLAPSPAPL
jgi:hypothetical protein